MNIKSVTPLSLSTVSSRDEAARNARGVKEDSAPSGKKDLPSSIKDTLEALTLDQEVFTFPLLETVKWLSLLHNSTLRKKKLKQRFKFFSRPQAGFDKKI